MEKKLTLMERIDLIEGKGMKKNMMETEGAIDKIINSLRYDKVLDYIPNGSIVCDLGCGTGKMLELLSNRIEVGRGYDRDIRSRKKGNIILTKLDLTRGFPRAKADVIVLTAFIEHLNFNDTLSLLKKCYKLLNPGGKIIITTPSKYGDYVLRLLFKIGICNKGILEHIKIWEKRGLRLSLEHLGYKNVVVKYFELGMNIIAIGEKKNEAT